MICLWSMRGTLWSSRSLQLGDSAALLDLRHQRASVCGRYGDVLLRDESSRGVGIFFLLSGTALFAYLLATVVTLATIEFKMMSCHSYFAKPVRARVPQTK